MQIEDVVGNEILELEARIAEFSRNAELKREELRQHASLRSLLFEKCQALEASVREALGLVGFDASNFKDKESEFDALFVSAEGRFIGEVEGKDTKSINVDKYSQLERNINEDLNKDNVSEQAKGILFGNAYRLTPVEARGEFFTEKVVKSAKRTGVALVRTPDLFMAARYLKENEDEDFARRCKMALKLTAGEIVVFPLTAIQKAENSKTEEPIL